MATQLIDRLARRVRWLDQHRRRTAWIVGIVFAVIGWWEVPRLLGPDWPRLHARLLVIAGTIAVALIVEFVLAGVMAVWEMQHDRLVRGGLPRAELVQRRK